MIHHVPHKSRWDDVPRDAVAPSKYTKKAGRLKKIRVREEGESKAGSKRFTVRCANCKATRHSKMSYKNPKTSNVKKVIP